MRWRGANAWVATLSVVCMCWTTSVRSQIHETTETLWTLSPTEHVSSSQTSVTSDLDDQTQRRTQWPGNKIVIPAADQSFSTRPAAFGPDKVDDDGLWGTMIPIQNFLHDDARAPPHNTGCPDEVQALWMDDLDESSASFLKHVWTFSRGPKRPPSDWIALVERGRCSFEDKVRTAQRMGAQAVIVGDAMASESFSPLASSMNLREWEEDMEPVTRPITMQPDSDAKDIVIPSCFVIRSSYLDLMEYVSQAEQGLLPGTHHGVRVGLFLDANVTDSPWLDLGLAFFLLPSLFALFAVVSHHVRALIKRYRDRASLHAVRSLPCFEWHPDCAWVAVKPEDVPGAPSPDIILRGMQAVDTFYAWLMHICSRPHDERDALMTHMEQAQYDTFSMDPMAQRSGWFLQEECPICLVEFTEGFVMRVCTHSQGYSACIALWTHLPPSRNVCTCH